MRFAPLLFAAALPLSVACSAGETVDRRPRDAAVDAGEVDAGPTGTDAGPTGTDAGPMGIDAGPMGIDAGPMGIDAGPGVDAGPPRGDGQYLDECSAPIDCVSDLCVADGATRRFCSRSCTRHGDCADEHVCAGGACVPDDSGTICPVATPEVCATGLCLGPSGGSGQCTRDCESALDCPAGWACTEPPGGGAFRICVDIEKPCTAGGTECGTGLCIPDLGCTATCRGAADCPSRATYLGLPAYRCAAAFGSSVPICAPPVAGDGMGGDIRGDDAIGTVCPASGFNECRSGLCVDFDETDANPPMCTQVCGAEGGCAPGFGCKPEVLDDGSIRTFCARAGGRVLGESCGAARDCQSALCDTGGYCTRLCQDGLCPTGWRCEPLPGTTLGLCRR